MSASMNSSVRKPSKLMIEIKIQKPANYQQHRKRILSAQPKIDTKPPKEVLTNVKNNDLAKKRVKLFKNDFLSLIMGAARDRKTNHDRGKRLRNRELVPDFLQRASDARSHMSYKDPTKRPITRPLAPSRATLFWQYSSLSNKSAKKETQKVSPKVKVCRNLDCFLGGNTWMRRVMRPLVWFDINVRGMGGIGRLYMRLYTEACPSLVLEFTRVCAHGLKERIKISRLFSQSLMQCSMVLDNDILNTGQLDFNANTLDASKHGGVLLFPKSLANETITGPNNLFSFSMALEPLHENMQQQVAFGQLLQAREIFKSLTKFAGENGKLKAVVYLSDCGLVGRDAVSDDEPEEVGAGDSHYNFPLPPLADCEQN